MADNRKTFKIKSDQVGDVRVADEVVAIIAGLATTEVEGVSSMAEYYQRDCEQAWYEESFQGNSCRSDGERSQS